MSASSGDTTPPGRRLGLVLPSLVAVLVLTSCVSGGGDGSDDEGDGGGGNGGGGGSESDVIASAVTTGSRFKDGLEFQVKSLERQGDDRALLRMTMVNSADEDVSMVSLLGESQYMPSGVTLVDPKNQKRHWPLRDPDDNCLCSDFTDHRIVSPGEETDFWIAYTAPPDDVTNLAVTTYLTPDILDIPITDAEEPNEEITDAETNDESRVWDLRTIAESEESTRDETGDETSIMLSSDVLFDTNKSDLKSAAQDTLEQVATEIDDSSDDEVNIDGYTDNTGDDSINNPLSKDRAEAVQDELEELVSRDVTFNADGHGSSDPVANNDSEEGREKNRRVTISFEK